MRYKPKTKRKQRRVRRALNRIMRQPGLRADERADIRYNYSGLRASRILEIAREVH